jgi:hypothetical protein
LRLGVLVALCTISHPVFAVGSYLGRLEEVWANSEGVDNVGWVKPVGSITNPACTNAGWYAVDLTDPAKKHALSFALAALAAGREVRLYGTGTCYASGTYEYLRAVAVK